MVEETPEQAPLAGAEPTDYGVPPQLPYYGNIQFSKGSVNFNVRVTGDLDFDLLMLDNLAVMADHVFEKALADVPKAVTSAMPSDEELEAPICPVHGQEMKYIQAGTSKKTGRPYPAFFACNVSGCSQTENV